MKFTALVILILAANSAFPVNLTNVDFSRILRDRIDRDKLGVGIVIGVIDQRGAEVYSCGKMRAGEAAEVDGDTLFEIGSITKLFTSLVLQEMADNGELRLDDPVKNFCPPG